MEKNIERTLPDRSNREKARTTSMTHLGKEIIIGETRRIIFSRKSRYSTFARRKIERRLKTFRRF